MVMPHPLKQRQKVCPQPSNQAPQRIHSSRQMEDLSARNKEFPAKFLAADLGSSDEDHTEQVFQNACLRTLVGTAENAAYDKRYIISAVVQIVS